jgi:hypothetical protein
MNTTSNNPARLLSGLMLLALVISVYFLASAGKAKKQTKELKQKIHTMGIATEQALSSLPIARAAAQQFRAEFGEQTVPTREPIEWCTLLLTRTARQSDLDIEYEFSGPKMPRDMAPTKAVRQLKDHAFLELIPYAVRIKFTGSRTQTLVFFSLLEQTIPTSLITLLKMDQTTEESSLYDVSARILIPTFLYPENLTKIQEL